MKIQKQMRFVEGQINSTNVLYTRSPLQGQPEIIKANENLRLVFRGGDLPTLVDLANSTINVTLQIQPGQNGNGSPLVLNTSILDIFYVQSVVLNGTTLNMNHLDYSRMLYRKVRDYCDGNPQRLQTGLQNGHNYFNSTGFGASQPDCLSTNDLAGRAYSNPLVHIAQQESFRHIPEVQRHYTQPAAGAGADTGIFAVLSDTDINNNYKNYSFKLKELLPELENFTVISNQMLMGSGLELNLTLIKPDLCMQRVPSALPVYSPNTARQADDSYYIKNIYTGICYHSSMDSGLGMIRNMPFTTLYHTRSNIGQFNSNNVWSMPSCFLRGFIVVYSPQTMVGTVGNNTGTNLAIATTLAGLNTAAAPVVGHNLLAKSYFQPRRIVETQMQIGDETFAKTSTVPVGQRGNMGYLLSQMFSEQLMGASYNSSLDRFNSIDFCQFIPVQRIYNAGTQIQWYQGYDDAGATFGSQEINFIAICDRILSFDDDSTTRIEVP